MLRDLSLWEKRNDKIMTLSGGMKRRVLIAKALAHEPEILFLDEPTAGVDVELRRDMWALVRGLRASGVTAWQVAQCASARRRPLSASASAGDAASMTTRNKYLSMGYASVRWS